MPSCIDGPGYCSILSDGPADAQSSVRRVDRIAAASWCPFDMKEARPR